MTGDHRRVVTRSHCKLCGSAVRRNWRGRIGHAEGRRSYLWELDEVGEQAPTAPEDNPLQRRREAAMACACAGSQSPESTIMVHRDNTRRYLWRKRDSLPRQRSDSDETRTKVKERPGLRCSRERRIAEAARRPSPNVTRVNINIHDDADGRGEKTLSQPRRPSVSG